MASRELVYEKFGRAAEVAQLLETHIGTSLLALDALQTGSFLDPDADAYLRLSKAIDGQTLGHSLKRMKLQLRLSEDLETHLSQALVRRNHLAHHFFGTHGLALLTEEGRESMVLELEEIHAALQVAYSIAGRVAQALVTEVLRLAQGQRADGA